MNRMIARLRTHGIVTASHMIGIGIMLLVLGLANTGSGPWLSAVVAAAGLFSSIRIHTAAVRYQNSMVGYTAEGLDDENQS